MTHIIAITWARNEEDILETFIRHNAPYIDRMIIVLHRSIDSSKDILLKLIQEGYPLEIAENNTYAYRQSAALTTLMHEISHRKNPDWILPLDADEFLVHHLASLLSKLSQHSLQILAPSFPGEHIFPQSMILHIKKQYSEVLGIGEKRKSHNSTKSVFLVA